MSQPNPKLQAAIDRFEAKVRRVAPYVGLGVASLFPLSFLAGVAACLWGGLVADAPVYVHHDGVGVVSVSVDGVEVAQLDEAGATLLHVERGDHVLELSGARSARWEMDGANGLDEWLFLTNPDLCVAVVDVGRALRGPGDVPCDALDRTQVTCLYRRFPRRSVGAPTFSADELAAPEARRMHTLWLTVPCEELDGIEASEVLAEHLGCGEGGRTEGPPASTH